MLPTAGQLPPREEQGAQLGEVTRDLLGGSVSHPQAHVCLRTYQEFPLVSV